MKRGSKGGVPPPPTAANAPVASTSASALAPLTDSTIYKATYSGVPVYEFIAKGIACMRRRSDGWLNATQILKVADYDKPQRTRILEREVQRGLHEKVQGGYGKYQGTWVPLERGREIAKLYNVEEILAPIFDFRPSTESPPLAPKHVTAASSKPRPARANAARAAPAPRRNLKPTPPAPPSVDSVEEEEEEEEEDESMISDIEPLMSSPAPESSPAPDDDFSDFDDNIHHHPQSQHLSQPHHYPPHHSHSNRFADEEDEDVLEILPYHKEVGGTLGRKRKHTIMSHDEEHHLHPHHPTHPPPHYQNHPPHHKYNPYPTQQHTYPDHQAHFEQRRRQAYSDELLDYFMSSGGGDLPTFLLHPPPDFNVNEIIDDEAHTAFHWAAAMGDLQVLELLLHAGADITQVNARGETPLMRAVLFTNNYDRKSFPRLVELLRSTIPHTDKFRSSVFHHIAATTLSRNKCIAARYYADVLLQKMAEIYPMADIAVQLNGQDQEGDTALTIAARNGAKKLIRSLLAYNTNPHIPNTQGQTADELIVEVEKRKAYAHAHQLGYHHSSSSPYQPHIPLPAAPGTPKIGPISGPSNAPGANYPPAAQFPRPPLPPPPPQPHISEAAIRATQKAIPDIAEKLEALARAFDMELEEKEKDLRQARKLLEDTERERGGVGGMVRDLERACVVGVVGDKVGVEEGKGVEVVTGEIEKLRVEEEMLAKELRRQVEMRQEVELRWLVEEMEKERGVATDNVPPPSTGNGNEAPAGDSQSELEQQLQADAAAATATNATAAAAAEEAESLEEKLATAKELARLQSERKELVGRIVGLYARSSSTSSRASATQQIQTPSYTEHSHHQPPPPSQLNGANRLTAATAIATPPQNARGMRMTMAGLSSGGAGPGMTAESRISAYRRLIAHCVGLEIHRVEEILPELLRTLEGPEEEEVGVATTEGVGPVAGGR